MDDLPNGAGKTNGTGLHPPTSSEVTNEELELLAKLEAQNRYVQCTMFNYHVDRFQDQC